MKYNAFCTAVSTLLASLVAVKVTRYVLIQKERTRLAPLFDLELKTSPNELTSLEPRIWSTSRCRIENAVSDLSCAYRLVGLLTEPHTEIESLLAAIASVRLEEDWIIDMDIVNADESVRWRCIPSKQLFCAIAQLLDRPPALSNFSSALPLCIVRTQTSFYFGILLPIGDSGKFDNWNDRPFIFSAALSVEIAEACVNILLNRLQKKSKVVYSNGQPPVFLDPTCGSGTAVFVARTKGCIALGSDVNSAFIEGARLNLEHCRIDMSGVYLSVRDAAEVAVALTAQSHYEGAAECLTHWSDANIMLCNLPWSENKLEYFGENDRIVQRLGAELRRGCECAFITRHGLPQHLLTDAGFETWAVVPVGQAVASKKAFGGRCFITFTTKI